MPTQQPSQDQPILNVVGEKVALGPLRRELLPLYQRWINDFSVSRTLLLVPRPVTAEAETAWYERVATSEQDVSFLIYEQATLRPIGVTDLRQIDHQHRTAEFGIMIGERDCWGKGYGTEATMLVLDYAFSVRGLHNVMLRVYAYNPAGIRAYQKAGFREFGRRRQCHRLADRTYDVVYMDCLASEFQGDVVRRMVVGEE